MAVYANDWIGITINLDGVFEWRELELIFKFLGPLQELFCHGLALDIGANIGNHSVFFDKIFARTYSFEPNPATYRLLRFNTDYTKNVRIFDYGLGNKAGQYYLFENPQNVGGASLTFSNMHASESTKIEVRRLDSCGVDLGGLCLMKVDVEGYEAEVFYGSIETIKTFQPVILFEQFQNEFIGGTTKAIEILKDLGYTFCWYQIDRDNRAWVLRRLRNIMELIRGRTIVEEIVCSDVVPPDNYSLLIAVPLKHRNRLGLPL